MFARLTPPKKMGRPEGYIEQNYNRNSFKSKEMKND